jgi:hypothetical protein
VTGTDVAIVLPQEAERALVFWRNNPMLPASYTKAGQVDWDGMRRAAWLLTWLDVDVAASLGDTFVIKDQVGLKADLQRALLARVPGYDLEVLELDDEHIVARIATPTGWKPPLTKWIGDRDMVEYATRNKDNYDKKPRRMLVARVTTDLIDLYAKGVIRGLVRAQAGDAAAIYTDAQPDQPAVELPARATAPDGSTIPEPLREPPVSDQTRGELASRVAALQPDPLADLTATCKDLRLPNLRSNRFTRAHGALLDRLIAEVVDRWGTGEIVEEVPHAVYDDSPESSDAEPGAERYDPDDPTRPY